MNFDQGPLPIKKLDPKEAYKQALSDQILRMPKSASLEAMADLLGAREFLVFNDKNKTWNFNAKGFIEKSAQEKFAIKLPDNVTIISQTILPPDEGVRIIKGSGAGVEEKGTVPRTRFLMEILQEMNLSYEVIEGTNNSRMMRKLNYRAFLIKYLEKVVLVNDEEDNATFVIFGIPYSVDELKRIFKLTKEDLKSQPNVEAVIYTGEPYSWKDKIREILFQLEPEAKNIIQEKKMDKKIYKPKGFWLSASIEELKAEIRQRGLDPENLPTQKQFTEGNADLLGGLVKKFGNLNKARKELGGDVLIRSMGYWQNTSVEEIKEELIRLGFDPKNLPAVQVLAEKYSSLVAGLAKRFGSFANARTELGGSILIRPAGYWQKLTIEELKTEIRKRGLDPANLPAQKKLAKENSDLVSGISIRFGNLSKARKELGGYLFRVPNGYWQNSTIQEIINEIKKRGLDPRNLPGMQKLHNKGNSDLLSGLVQRFGGMTKAREALKSLALEQKSKSTESN